jgi:transcriptional regulator with XRE-family HTH domain
MQSDNQLANQLSGDETGRHGHDDLRPYRPQSHWASAPEPVEDVPGFGFVAGRFSDRGLGLQDLDGLEQGLLRRCETGHVASPLSKLVCSLDANKLADKGRKMLCMKSLGELVKEWREASGLKTADLAKLVGGTVKRQHIEQLEKAGSRTPRYIAELAKAMGTTVDNLLALRMPPPHGKIDPKSLKLSIANAPPAKPPKGFKTAARMATEEEVKLLDALGMLLPEDRDATVQGIFERAEKQLANAQRLINRLSKKPEGLEE